MTDFIKKQRPFLFILIVVIIGYWQVSLLFYALKWDLIDVVFPFRFYFSECFRSGHFPFWNPYLQTGTPFFADLQAPVYYPELPLISLFGGYGIYTMHLLFIAYLFIAALGMYQLSFFFNRNRLASLMAGIAYAFSGYVVSHGQHFFLLVGAAWIPFVVKNYIQLLQEGGTKRTLKTAVFVFLMVSGAYQALSIALFYLLVLLLVLFIAKEIAQKNPKKIFKAIKSNLFLFFVVLTLLLPLIAATLEIIGSVNRLSDGISPEKISHYGQSLKTLASFLLPFSTLKHEYFGDIDTSLINHYFGLIPLLFFSLSLTKKHTAPEYLILAWGLVIFASSFRELPVREFMFLHVPLMNLFKYAAYISIFGLLAFILLAANYFSFVQQNFEREKNKILITGVLLWSVLLFAIVFSYSKTSITEIRNILSLNSWNEFIATTTISQTVLLQAILQFFIVGIFLAIVIWRKQIKFPFHLMVAVVIFDMMASAQLNMTVSVVDTSHKPSHMKKDLALSPRYFPVPVDDKIIFNDKRSAFFAPFWRNTYIFSKQISFDAFSSFELDSFNKLDDDYPNLKEATINNHLFYFSDTILPLSLFDDNKIDKQKSSKWLYLSDDDYDLLSKEATNTDSTNTVTIKAFSPNKVIAETTTQSDCFLTMLQTNYKGWKAYIDNTPAHIYTSNFNYRTIFLPKGNHSVKFEYKNNKVLILYYISNLAFILIVLFLVGHSMKNRNYPPGLFWGIPLAVTLLLAVFIPIQFSGSRESKNASEIHHGIKEKKEAVYNEQKISKGEAAHIKPSDEYFPIATIENQKLQLKKGTLVITAKVFSESYPRALIVSDISQKDGKNWQAAKIERQIEGLNTWNEITYFRNFYDLKDEDIISVYLWNLNKCSFTIKDIEVSLYP
ncbi:hypothetical protein SAMN05444274_105121 [Mariniphaga anaerophila]|uniref:Membrane protein YfhO n=1 Tax=Mariniphaga anaerophila TaxID=1484053 RepID=A0A1M5BFN4_9BACT|nr:hypothetical protein [Mariniphaga anaerophila]SHF41137.1 hypothetical protein SAMN05444274_105121 [Mariniphaga anaerophila]